MGIPSIPADGDIDYRYAEKVQTVLGKVVADAFGAHHAPREVHFFKRLDDVPDQDVAPQVRMWLDFTAINNEIAAVRWNFARARLDALRAGGLAFTDASLATVRIAQARFVADSPKLQAFIARYREEGTTTPRFVVHDGPAPAAAVANS